MPRQPRQFEIDGIYHVIKRGVEQRDIFLKPQDYHRFILGLEFCNTHTATNLWPLVGSDPTQLGGRLAEERAKKRTPLVELLAFTLMPNHIHLILQETLQGGISKFMQKLGGYSTYFNKQYKRVGTLFQSHFKDVRIHDDIQLHNVFVYVHTNPVELWESGWKKFSVRNTDNAIQKLEQYWASSYSDYIGKENFPFVTTKDFFLKFFGDEQKCRQAVEDWIRLKGGQANFDAKMFE